MEHRSQLLVAQLLGGRSAGFRDVMPRLTLTRPREALPVVGMFVGTWAIALSIWRLGHIEERWSAHLEEREIGATWARV